MKSSRALCAFFSSFFPRRIERRDQFVNAAPAFPKTFCTNRSQLKRGANLGEQYQTIFFCSSTYNSRHGHGTTDVRRGVKNATAMRSFRFFRFFPTRRQ